MNAVADANGIANAALPTRSVGSRWTILFIHVESDSALSSVASVYLNQQPIVGSKSGNFDNASGDPPIPVTGKDSFIIQWTGCTPGAKCSAVLWYNDAVH